MQPKHDYENFYKLVKLFFIGVQVSSLRQIHRSDLVFELECSKNGNSNIHIEI